MAERPRRNAMKTGIVTLLFTDLVGSSELLGKLGDDAADRVRRRHFRLLRATVQRYGGDEVKSLGDGLMIVFPSALDAVSCAVAMQRVVQQHSSERPGEGVEIRMGLHAGEPLRDGDDYFGQAVVVAKRLCDAARGGQIVVSDVVHSIVGSRGDFDFRDLGPLSLKGVPTPISVREVTWSPSPAAAVVEEHPARRRPSGVGRGLLRAGAGVAVTVALVAAGLALFRSGDRRPLRWARVEPDGAVLGGPGDQRINYLLAHDDGVIAVGQDAASGQPDAAVWTSEDGLDWSRQSQTDLDAEGGQAMYAVVRGGPGFVAAGYRGEGGDLDAAVWTSEEGRAWDAVRDQTSLGGAGNQVINHLTTSPNGLIAVGYEGVAGDRDVAIWRSRNGLSWHRDALPEDVAGGEGRQGLHSVAALGRRLVAVGSDNVGGSRDAAVWTSSDGLSWRRVPHVRDVFGGPREQNMTSVTAAGGGFVAVGWDTPKSNLDAAVWTSGDGLVWRRAGYDEAVFGGSKNQLLWGIEVTDDGFIAVGRDGAGGGSDAAMWTSIDGKRWRHAPSDESVFGGDRAQEMRWIATLESRLIGAGWDRSGRGQDAAIWWADA